MSIGKIVVGTMVASAVLAAVGAISYQIGANHAIAASKMSASMMSATASKSGKAKSTKAPKKSCIEFGFLNEVVAAGSSTPIGAEGPNGLLACFPDFPTFPGTTPALDSALCCDDLGACIGGSSDACDAYYECLEDPANGPVLVGNWWLQRDVNNGEMFFEENAVCGRITESDLNSRTRFELWEDTFLGMDLSLFKKFSAGYDFRSVSGGSGGYLNLYLRATDNGDYYNCNFVFDIPNEVGTGTLVITPETVPDSVRASGTNTNGCTGTPTIQDYVAANPGAVIGVGNGELYAFVLNTGSTNQDNNGQEICWSDVSIQYVDDVGNIYANNFEFTLLQ
mmetsp:Transcript_18851/g.29540  ORF Transcript_18851/g.29540 Transcript_18851/m.29540 type:complete len:337 (-) Transcript_18851:141-1151(-)